MADRLYVASLEPRGGRSVITLGLMEMLTSRTGSVGYVRPIIATSEGPDPRIELIRRRYNLDVQSDQLAFFGSDEVAELLAAGRADDVMQQVLEKARRVEEQFDFVLYDGTDYSGAAAALEFEVNARIANNLGAPVLALVNGVDRSPDEIVERARIARESLHREGCAIAAIVVNRVDPAHLDVVRERIARHNLGEPVWVLPEVPLLRMPNVREVMDALDADQVAGVSADLDVKVSDIKIAAMSLPNVLSHLNEGTLAIVPGDRSDVIVGALASRLSTTMPNIAAILLTGGFELHGEVSRLLDGIADLPVPILAVASDTWNAAKAVAEVPAQIRASSHRKITTALGVFEEHVDIEALEQRIEVTRTDRVTPLMFEYDLLQRARGQRKHVVLPEGEDDRILKAAEILLRRNVVDLTLLGDVDQIRTKADALGVNIEGLRLIDPAESELLEPFAQTLFELRKHRGVTEDAAREATLDVTYFGTMMVHQGYADGMVSGAMHTTGHTIRPAFQIIKTVPGVSLVSSVFLMALADRVLVYGDCAVNPNPDADGLADIAISSARTAAMFGIEPRIAMLSYSTGESGSGDSVEKVRRATELVREREPELRVAGPIQYDAAVDAAVGAQKMPGSEVAGRATVFIFPDLNTGNNTYKAVQRSSGAVAIGPVLQGLNKPVNDLSRGCTVKDIVNTVTITAVQAQN